MNSKATDKAVSILRDRTVLSVAFLLPKTAEIFLKNFRIEPIRWAGYFVAYNQQRTEGGENMQNTTERRQEILYFISDRRHVKMREIADEFHIGINTAKRDVQILMCSHPIYTEGSRAGGVRAMDGWYASKRYLTDEQEALLRKLTAGLQPEDQKTMESILNAFAKPQVKERNS